MEKSASPPRHNVMKNAEKKKIAQKPCAISSPPHPRQDVTAILPGAASHQYGCAPSLRGRGFSLARVMKGAAPAIYAIIFLTMCLLPERHLNASATITNAPGDAEMMDVYCPV